MNASVNSPVSLRWLSRTSADGLPETVLQMLGPAVLGTSLTPPDWVDVPHVYAWSPLQTSVLAPTINLQRLPS